MKIVFGFKLVLFLAVIPISFCMMWRAPCQADGSTSTLQDTIKWLTERGHQYGTFQPRIEEEIPPVETQFAVTDNCQLKLTIVGGCGYGGPFDRHVYRISLSEIDPSASEIEPVVPIGVVDEYLLLLRGVGDDRNAIRVETMNGTISTWTPLSEIRLCTGSHEQADQLRSHLNQAAQLCGAAP